MSSGSGWLFPGSVRFVAHVGDHRSHPAPSLMGPEHHTVANASRARAAEFAWGRWCARRALVALGVPAVEIPSSPRREPRWPSGTVGSITHCAGYVAAAVGRSFEFAGLGLDAEPRMALARGDKEAVLSPTELRHLEAFEHPDAALVAFCGKEAVFKAVFPHCRCEIDFLAVELDMEWAAGRFTARPVSEEPVCVAAAIRGILGRFLVSETHVVTGAALPRTSV